MTAVDLADDPLSIKLALIGLHEAQHDRSSQHKACHVGPDVLELVAFKYAGVMVRLKH
jgi:hypothetical protein